MFAGPGKEADATRERRDASGASASGGRASAASRQYMPASTSASLRASIQKDGFEEAVIRGDKTRRQAQDSQSQLMDCSVDPTLHTIPTSLGSSAAGDANGVPRADGASIALAAVVPNAVAGTDSVAADGGTDTDGAGYPSRNGDAGTPTVALAIDARAAVDTAAAAGVLAAAAAAVGPHPPPQVGAGGVPGGRGGAGARAGDEDSGDDGEPDGLGADQRDHAPAMGSGVSGVKRSGRGRQAKSKLPKVFQAGVALSILKCVCLILTSVY